MSYLETFILPVGTYAYLCEHEDGNGLIRRPRTSHVPHDIAGHNELTFVVTTPFVFTEDKIHGQLLWHFIILLPPNDVARYIVVEKNSIFTCEHYGSIHGKI